PGIGLRERDAARPGALAESIDRQALWQSAAGGGAGLVIGGLVTGWSLLGTVMGLIIGAALGLAILGSHGEERRRVIALFIVAFFVVFFWAAFDQSGSSMSLFADRNTDLHLGSLTL